MKKKIFLTAAIAAVMALSLVGCGGVKVTNIAMPQAATIEKGESVTLPINFGTDKAPAETPVLMTGDTATAESADVDEKLAAAAEKLTIEWTSSDESVVTVDENGVVTAVGAGEADITAAVKDANISSVTHVKVVILPTGVDAPDTLELYTNGESEKSLGARIIPEDATEVKLAYVSSNEGVATVDETGLVTAVADGECTITAYIVADAPATAESATQKTAAVVTDAEEEVTSEAASDAGIAMMPEDLADVDSAFGVVPDEMKSETKVTVSTKVEKIELDQTKGTLKVGNSVTINATVTPDEATDKTITWSSSDEKVATVDSNGKVTAVASGNAVITATSESNDDVKADYDVTVTDKATSSSSSNNKGATSSKGNTSSGSSWTGGSTSTGSSSAGSTTTTPAAPSNPAPAPAAPDPTPVQPSNPEPAQPSNPEPAPAPDPEPSQPSGGDNGGSNSGGGDNGGSGGNNGDPWGGPVISSPTDNGCPPDEAGISC